MFGYDSIYYELYQKYLRNNLIDEASIAYPQLSKYLIPFNSLISNKKLYEPNFIIKSTSELENFEFGYKSGLFTEYNDSFFEKNSLAIIYIKSSGTPSTVNFHARKSKNNLVVTYGVNSGIFDALDGHLIIIEIDKSITNISKIN